MIHELESFSMIDSRRVGPETYYDPEHLSIVRACRAFLDHGVEVRHLRMYKIAAEREAGVLEQLVMPLLKQRNPDARARAVDTVARPRRGGRGAPRRPAAACAPAHAALTAQLPTRR